MISGRGNEVVVENGGVHGRRAEDPLRVVSQELGTGSVARVPGLPLFVGGAVGYVGYEAATPFEKVPRHDNDELGVPDFCFMHAEIVVAFDHARRVMQVIAPTRPGGAPDLAYDSALKRIDGYPCRIDQGPRGAELGNVGVTCEVPLVEHTSRKEYVSQVERAKEHIAAGDIFQVVLSQRFSAPYDGDGIDLYRVLRAVNPSPYMFYLRTCDVTLVGSSPEPLVRVEGDEVLTRPLAGTRPRGASASEDGRLRADLLSDEKERAEHVMLVHLGRNDLGRVSAPGSVSVDELMEVEYYSHVMHIVSNVTGTLAPGKDAFDALEATFPAGTVSGAPKVRAMEIIRELEPAGAGPTRERWATSASTERWICASPSAPSCSRAVPRICSRERASWPTPIRRRSTRSAVTRRAHCTRRSSWRQACVPSRRWRDDPRHRQLRLLHLQPRPVVLGPRCRGRGTAKRCDHRRGGARTRAHGIVVSPGPGTPDDAGISRDVIRAAAQTVYRCSACVWGTSVSPRCSAAACAARRARSR